MSDGLAELLRECTVRVIISSNDWGTGFFVAPGLILTCEHVVRHATDQRVEVYWSRAEHPYTATILRAVSNGKTLDLALLQIDDPIPNHPCVYLDEATTVRGEDYSPGDDLFSYGYLKDYANAAGVTGTSEWYTGDEPPLMKFKGGQIQRGLSGGALLNRRTGKVVGLVKETRSSAFPMGGGAVPISIVYQQLADLCDLPSLQQAFHGSNARWREAVPANQLVPSPPELEGIHFGVPSQRNPYFTGRESILERLHQHLTHSTTTAITRVQAISGLGGIGKTQTAVEYAYRYHYDQQVYDHVFWVKADTEANLVTDFANLANQLALPVAQATQEEKVPAVRAWLASHHHWLLVFDNADTPDWLIDWMPNNPQGKVLITSRATVFDQLGIDEPLPLDMLSREEAVELLFRRTTYERTDVNVAAAIELNQELDGLPLALEQASAFMVRKRIGFETYLKTYRNRGLSLLEQGKAQTGRYPSSVLKTWAINFEAVAAENAASSDLLKFSAFLASDDIPYRILLEGATHLGETLSVCLQHDDTDERILALSELLEPLSQYSLVRWEPNRECYGVHRLVQAVVRDELYPATQVIWIEQVTSAMDAAYPGSDFQHWPMCAQFLPHWLRIREHAYQSNISSEVLALVLNQASFYLNAQGRYSAVEPLLKESLYMRQELLGESHPDVASSLSNLAFLYNNQGRYSEAEPLLQESLRMSRTLLGESHIDVASILNNLALTYTCQGRYGEAKPLYDEALKMRRELLGESHPDVIVSLNNLAMLYDKQGHYNKAEPLLQQALQMNKDLLGNTHPTVALSLNNLALFYSNQGRYGEAKPLYDEALKMRRELLGKSHPDVAVSLNNLALFHEKQHQYSEAKLLYEEALQMNKQLLGEPHPDVATNLSNLAGLYGRQGQHNKAEALQKEALQMRQDLFGEAHPDVAFSLNNLASTYIGQGRFDEAKPLLKKAFKLCKEILGSEHPHTRLVYINFRSLNIRQDQ